MSQDHSEAINPEALVRSLRMELRSFAASGSNWVSIDPEPGELSALLREAMGKPSARPAPVKHAAPPKAKPAAKPERKLEPVIAPSAAIEEMASYGGERVEQLTKMAEEVAKCAACGLCETRTQTAFSRGNPKSPLMFIGEAPGADEDAQGLPFVGRAGKLLDDIIVKGMGYAREDVYIANVLKCRPPNNRNPEPSEIEACRDYLFKQIEIVDPIVIIALGRFPAQWLLESKESIGKLRRRIWDKDGRHILCTYHPAYLLRNPSAKAAVWKDVQLVMDFFGRDKPLPMRD